jgi:cell division protease FtsH
MAYAMVAYYGMSPAVGNISFYDGTGQRDMFTKPFSEKTAELIDAEVRRLVDEAVELTRSIIETERENIERLADLLIAKETIFSEDVEAILGKSEQQKAKELLETESVKEIEIEPTDDVDDNESDVEVEVLVEDAEGTTTVKYIFDTESTDESESK